MTGLVVPVFRDESFGTVGSLSSKALKSCSTGFYATGIGADFFISGNG